MAIKDIKRRCAVCGAALPRRRYLYCSDECRAAALSARHKAGRRAAELPPLDRRRTCPDCGRVFEQRGSAVRCAECQRERNAAAKLEHIRRAARGHVRHIGDVDICERCGGRYKVTGSHQRYCPECRLPALREARRAAERERRAKLGEDCTWRERERMGKRVRSDARACAECGKRIEAAQRRAFCSEACRAAYRARVGAPSDDVGAAPRQSRAAGLAALRVARGMTQRQLARACGVDQAVVSRWEHGAACPERMRGALCEALGCSEQELREAVDGKKF